MSYLKMFLLLLAFIIVQQKVLSQTFCRGYKECANDPTITSPVSKGVYCLGGFSCYSAKTILTGSGVSCYGGRSCSNVSSIDYLEGAGASLGCSGSESCIYSTIHMKLLVCSGYASCLGTIVNQTATIYAQSIYSLMNATIYANNINISLILSGYMAAFGAIIHCTGSSICNINCATTACINLSLLGSGQYIITYESMDTKQINMNSQQNQYQPYLFLDEIANDLDCNISFDLYLPQSQRPDIDENSDVCCRAEDSCREITIISSTQLMCTSNSACKANGIMQSINGDIICSARYGCWESQLIIGYNIYCSGFWACGSVSNITVTKSIECSGTKGCWYSNIYIENNYNVSVYLWGDESGTGSTIYCSYGSICNIFCKGKGACNGMNEPICIGQCIVECDSDSGCPDGYVPPTQAPTMTTDAPTTSNPTTLNPTTLTPTTFTPTTLTPTTLTPTTSSPTTTYPTTSVSTTTLLASTQSQSTTSVTFPDSDDTNCSCHYYCLTCIIWSIWICFM
eukprot:182297_1